MRAQTPAQAQGIGTVQQVYDGVLRPDEQARTFRAIERLFPTRAVQAGPAAQALPYGQPVGNFRWTSRGRSWDLYDYLALNRVSGLLMLKAGRIRMEAYELGNTEQSRWMSMSIAKSVTSTLAGAAIQDGHLESLDDPVVRYLPQLRATAYDGVSVRNVIQMASGVEWNEDYLDPMSDRRRMLLAQSAQQPGGILGQMGRLRRAAPPGTCWNYSTGETHVLGAVVRSAVGRPLAQYLSEKIWMPAGMEAAASWWLESPDGLEVGGSGISATLRDYGRLGLFLLNGGVFGPVRVLPDGWVREASTPKVIGGRRIAYGYMLWPIPDAGDARTSEGAFEARGIFGQHIYVNPSADVVIVVWSALPKPVNMATISDHDFFAAAVLALRREEGG